MGNHLFKSEQHVRTWPGGKSTLNRALYSIDLRQLIADLLTPTPSLRPTAEKVYNETFKENLTIRQGDVYMAVGLSRLQPDL